MFWIIILALLFIVYALINAYTEALYHDYLYTKNLQHPNLHTIYVLERSLVTYLIWLKVSSIVSFADSIMFLIALACMYSFFHNGLLYTVRNILNPAIYKKRWWGSKVKGADRNKAIWEFNAKVRTIMFIFGVSIIIYILFSQQ